MFGWIQLHERFGDDNRWRPDHMVDDAASRLLRGRIVSLTQALDSLRSQGPHIAEISVAISRRLQAGGTVFAVGNGGSASLAEHFCAELLGRLRSDRPRAPLAARTLVGDITTLTALSNDYGYANAFARVLLANVRPSDVLVHFSTSGLSDNLVAVDRVASVNGIYRVSFLGAGESPLNSCDGVVRVASSDAGTIQECHLLLIHMLVELIEDVCSIWWSTDNDNKSRRQ